MPAEEYFNLYKRCVDIQSIQFTLDDFKKFQKSTNVRIFEDKNCIAILGLTDIEIEIIINENKVIFLYILISPLNKL